MPGSVWAECTGAARYALGTLLAQPVRTLVAEKLESSIVLLAFSSCFSCYTR